MNGFDEFIMRMVNDWRTPILDRVMTDITSLGSVTLLIIQTSIAVLLFKHVSRNSRAAAQVTVAFTGAQILVEILKRLLRRERPHLLVPLVQATGYSYPSGHTMSSTAFYLTLALIVSSGLKGGVRLAVRLAFGLLILLVGISRIYLGVHYPTDVLSGIVLGTVWSMLTLRFVGRRRNRANLFLQK